MPDPDCLNTLRCAAVLSELPRLGAFVDAYCRRHRLSDTVCRHAHLVLEELFTNAVTHGQAAQPTTEVTAALSLTGDGLQLVVEDDGAPFEPRPQPPVPAGTPLEAWPVGGLGLRLIHELAADVRYERLAAGNRLTITLPLARPDGASG